MLLLIIKLIITSPGGPWAPQGPDALQSSLIASAWQKVCTVPTQGSNKSSWHARTEMHQTKESGSLRSRAPKGVCALGQAPWTRSPRSHPAGSSPRPRRRRPTRLQTRTKSVSRPGHQVRKLSLCLSPEAGGRQRYVQPEIPGPRQAQAGSYLRPRPARLPAPTARPAPETGSDRRQTPPKALELLPQPDPGAWDSAPSIRLRARSASPTSRAWAAPSLTPRRPAGRAGPARTAHRGRGKVSPLCSAPYPSNKSLCGLPCLHLVPLECRLQAMCWVCSQLKMPRRLGHPSASLTLKVAPQPGFSFPSCVSVAYLLVTGVPPMRNRG